MRRSPATTLLLAALMVVGVTTLGQAQDAAPAMDWAPYVEVNGTLTDMPSSPAVLTAGEILVPVLDLFGIIGGDVAEAAEGRQFTVTRGNVVMQLVVDQSSYQVGDQSLEFTIYPVLVGGIAYLDLRDITEALGGTYTWDPATMTAAIAIQPVSAVAKTVTGALVYVDKRQQPPFFLVTPTGAQTPTPYVGAQNVEFVRSGAGGVTETASIDDLEVGDDLELGLDQQDRVVRVSQIRNLVTGTIEYIGGNLILLQTAEGRRHFTLVADARIADDAGRSYDRNQLKAGQRATVSVAQSGKDVTAITVYIAAEAPAGQAPAIAEVTVQDYRKPLKKGDKLVVRMSGTAGGTASFDIGALITGVRMTEEQAGRYIGQYTVRDGDGVTDATVTARLSLGGQVAAPAAGAQIVTIDTTPPTIPLATPKNGEAVRGAPPTIVVQYSDANGSGIDPAQTQLVLDGKSVTKEANIDTVGISYQTANLAFGDHTYQVRIADAAGNPMVQDFQFAMMPEGKILAFTHDGRQALRIGDKLTAELEATEAGGKAYFTIAGNWRRVNMARVGDTNKFQGTYTIADADRQKSAAIVGHFVDANGKDYESRSDVKVSIGWGTPTKLEIRDPADGAAWQDTSKMLQVMGLAPPGRKVRVSVQYPYYGYKTRKLDEDTVTSNQRGVWRTKDMKMKLSGLKAAFVTEYKVVAEMLGDGDKVDEKQEITIKLGKE